MIDLAIIGITLFSILVAARFCSSKAATARFELEMKNRPKRVIDKAERARTIERMICHGEQIGRGER
jgi:hypothetical protein